MAFIIYCFHFFPLRILFINILLILSFYRPNVMDFNLFVPLAKALEILIVFMINQPQLHMFDI